MATMHTTPFDLYEETAEELFATQDQHDDPHGVETHPRENGVFDEPAVTTSVHGLERVLGW